MSEKTKEVNENLDADVLMDLYSTGDAFFTINKKMVRVFGPAKAFFLANLIDKLKYHKTHNTKEIKDGWFFQSHEYQRKETGLSEYTIRKCKKEFEDAGILEIEKRGIPGREWYHINFNKLHQTIKAQSIAEQQLKDSLGQGFKDSLGQGFKDSLGHNNNKSNNNKSKENKDKKNSVFLQLKEYFPEEWKKDRSFKKALKDFTLHRKEKHQPITPKAGKMLANKLCKYSIQQATAALIQSIENGWTGVFPASESKKTMKGSNNSSGTRRFIPNTNPHKYAEADKKRKQREEALYED